MDVASAVQISTALRLRGHATASTLKCLMSIEKRHREIATIIQEVKNLEIHDEAVSIRKSKRTKKISNGDGHKLGSPGGNANGTGEANSGENNSRKPVLKTPALRRLQKQNTRIDQRRPSKFTFGSRMVLRGELVKINAAIHKSLKLRPTLAPEGALRVLMGSIKLSQELKSELGKLNHLSKKQKGDNLYLAHGELRYIQEAIARLDVPPHATEISKVGQTLLDRLALAIFEDIQIVGNESRETLKRMLSYWRFASKKAYNAMVQNNQLVNWETGERLEEQEDPNEQEDK
ncbi:hypothetical protein EMCG_08694 [[Emmonsia] crescens]|uniref:Uncharacterized protein n=1 Tax=[Emmonsia] crescens TaxID=73230 RepID=A0A0G2I4E0_9EURO|nr:hypothetical protein EMCG_08694 [Emmonsia crescens UAMH 3008]